MCVNVHTGIGNCGKLRFMLKYSIFLLKKGANHGKRYFQE